jgi:hypothetical protein
MLLSVPHLNAVMISRVTSIDCFVKKAAGEFCASHATSNDTIGRDDNASVCDASDCSVCAYCFFGVVLSEIIESINAPSQEG